MRRFVLTVALLLATHPLARAGQVEAGHITGSDRPAIQIGGVIAAGDYQKFHALVATMTRPIIVTTGPGGLVAPALAIGWEIRARGLDTLVPPQTRCISACSLIWLGGTKRMLASGALIGFHAMSTMQRTGGVVETHEVDHVLSKYLIDLGYTLDATAVIVNTPSALVRDLDAEELNANGIDTASYP